MSNELSFLRNFSKLKCEDCESTEELTEHRFNGRVKCECCLNDQLRALEDENELEGYYVEQSYNSLIQERNA